MSDESTTADPKTDAAKTEAVEKEALSLSLIHI